MRRALLGLLICPHCGGAPLTADGEGERIEIGSLVCPQGHALPIRRGVLDALPALTPTISEQRAVGARERLGLLSSEEAESYRRHISQIGSATYNELIRDNARAALEALPPPEPAADLRQAIDAAKAEGRLDDQRSEATSALQAACACT